MLDSAWWFLWCWVAAAGLLVCTFRLRRSGMSVGTALMLKLAGGIAAAAGWFSDFNDAVDAFVQTWVIARQRRARPRPEAAEPPTAIERLNGGPTLVEREER